jgi:hypothetical protein
LLTICYGDSVSRWQIYEQNPFPDGPPHVEAQWYPESSRIREYCNYLMNDRLERQASRCAMPHVEAQWYPESSRIREYCNYLMNDRLERQASRCAMPHVCM